MKTNYFINLSHAILFPLLLHVFPLAAQSTKDWTPNEKGYYTNLRDFCNYLDTTNKIDGVDLSKYILLDYVLNDSSEARKTSRVKKIETLVSQFHHFLDSVGLSSLDAAPLRFYLSDPAIKAIFSDSLANSTNSVFAYFKKDHPNKPLGYVLFQQNSHRIVSWILINQGGTRYFLTFNMF